MIAKTTFETIAVRQLQP